MNASARSSYRDGLAAASSGNDAAARQAFEAALSADPSAFKAAYNLGVIADRAGNENRALEYYRQALRLQADYERAAEGITTIYVRRGAVADALAFIEPLARQWVRNLALQALYAEMLVASDRNDDAVTAARSALRRDERFVPAMIAIVKASLKRQPPRTELAASVLDQALAIDANHAEAHFLKGRMLQTESRLGEALAEYRRAVDLRPDFAEARVALGLQFIASGNYAEAEQAFEIAARLLPGSVEVALNLADAYRASKQWTKAKAAFDRAISMRERLPQAHFNLGLMYMAAGDQFPGMDKLTALQRATQEMNLYRDQMGPTMPRTDPSTDVLADLAKQIEREQKRLEREKVRLEREAAKKARDAARAAQAAQNAADAGTPPAAGSDAGTTASP
jgi:tetratricopeptide (TPR) repeat protein